MADATQIQYRGEPLVIEAKVDAGVTVGAGKWVGFDTTTGYLVELTDAANRIPLGISKGHTLGTETVDTWIEVYITAVFRMTGVTLAVTDNGKVAYCASATTFDTTSVNGNIVGKITEYVSATVGWVDIGAASQLTAAGTAISFSDTGTYYKVAALAGVTATAAIMEDHLDLDRHACDDGDGTYTVTPQTDRQHYAKAIQGNGTGIAYYVHASSDVSAKTIVRCSGETSGIPTVEKATNTTGTRPGVFYSPSAITSGSKGWVYTDYYESATGLAGATGDPIFRGVDGALTLTKPSGANRSQVVGRNLDGAGKAWMHFTEGVVPPHEHTDESEGGEKLEWLSFFVDATWVKDGTDKALVLPPVESPYAITIKRAFASVDTQPGGGKTLTLKVNTNTLLTIAGATSTGEDKALSINIAKDTDLDFTVSETAAGAGADLHFVIGFVKQAV